MSNFLKKKSLGKIEQWFSSPTFKDDQEKTLVARFLTIVIQNVTGFVVVSMIISWFTTSSTKFILSLLFVFDTSQRSGRDSEPSQKQFFIEYKPELRTPLNGILGYAQILKREPTLTTRHKRNWIFCTTWPGGAICGPSGSGQRISQPWASNKYWIMEKIK